MVVSLKPEIEQAVQKAAQISGKTPDEVVNETLSRELLRPADGGPREGDDWMRRLRSAATPAGVSLSDDAVSREGLYED